MRAPWRRCREPPISSSASAKGEAKRGPTTPTKSCDGPCWLLSGSRRPEATRRAGLRLGASREIVLSTGGTARLAESSVVRTAPGCRRRSGRPRPSLGRDQATDPRVDGERDRARVADDLFPGRSKKIDVAWSSADERVVATERLLFDWLAIDERSAGPQADEAAASLLAEKALALGIAAFAGDSFDSLVARIAFVTSEAPDRPSPRGGSSRSIRRGFGRSSSPAWPASGRSPRCARRPGSTRSAPRSASRSLRASTNSRPSSVTLPGGRA